MNIEKLRAETTGCSTKIHFNNAGAALMPSSVVDSMKDYLDLEAKVGGYEAADQEKAAIRNFYGVMAKWINTDERNIAFTSSATNSFARALSSIPFEKDDSILIANEDYISNQLAFLAMQKRFDLKIIRARSSSKGGVDVGDMKLQMDKHHPRLVSLTHIPTNSGLVQPVEEIGKLCKERNILYLVDACQSVGQWPVDVKKIQCDFLSATFRKFLRGPRGAGFLYVSDRVINEKLDPLFIDMRGATWTSADQYTSRMDAQRFEDWEIPYALLMGSRAAVDYALKAGIDQIVKRNKILCDLLRNKLQSIGFELLDQGETLSSIITTHIPGKDGTTIMHELRKKNINTSISYKDYAVIDFEKKGVDWALRISPHYYNTEEEIEIFMDVLTALKN
ncbi:MAG: aminotransferase class V-fold PLP-dependent enzyme [Flammeovirgaceae bacterium]|nr:aminotransferase class V-fold PLP-dependent enzyme [Flammeovirgaceae bacterium]